MLRLHAAREAAPGAGAAHADHWRPRTLAALRWLALGAVAVALLGLSAVRAVGMIEENWAVGDDFTPYWNGAVAVAEGRNPYGWLAEGRPQEVRDYIYPPLLALLLAPFTALMDYPTARWAWLGFSVLCTVAGLVLVWRTSRLRARGRAALALLPFLALIPPTTGALGFGQLSPQLLLVIAGAYAAVGARRMGAAGALLAVGTYLKSFPGVIALYLLARRRWRGCVVALGAGAALVALSLLVLGVQPHWDYLSGVVPAQRRWFAAMSNISFTGLFTRLFTTNLFAAPVVVADGLAALAIALCAGVVLAVSAYAIWRARADGAAEAAAFGVAVVAALVVSPINGTQNLLIAALPLAVAAAHVQAAWPHGLRWLLVVTLLLSLPVEPCDLAPLRGWCLQDAAGLPLAALPWRLGWGNLLTAGPLLGLLALWGLLVRCCLQPPALAAATRPGASPPRRAARPAEG